MKKVGVHVSPSSNGGAALWFNRMTEGLSNLQEVLLKRL